jgi:Flp pilus assembly pilin Flp
LKKLVRFFCRRSGQDTVEYALLAAFISTAALSALLLIGPHLKPIYALIQDAVRRAATIGPGEPGSGHKDTVPTTWWF